MKIRQRTAFGLSLFYLVTVIGLALNLHYCGGKLSSVKLNAPAECKVCKNERKIASGRDCCKTTGFELKVKDSHQAGLKVKLPSDFGIQLFLVPVSTVFNSWNAAFVQVARGNKAPPRAAIVPLHLFNCVFRN